MSSLLALLCHASAPAPARCDTFSFHQLQTDLYIERPGQLRGYFKPQVVLIALEILGSITTPMLLLLTASRMDDIARFVRDASMTSNELGHFFWYATPTSPERRSSDAVARKMYDSVIKSVESESLGELPGSVDSEMLQSALKYPTSQTSMESEP